jgi:hypothetical protein
MNSKLETYKLWAPCDAQWTEWVKPVLFANMVKRKVMQPIGAHWTDRVVSANTGKANAEPVGIPELQWISLLNRSAAIIVDLPGKNGVLEGLALARIGYRPIPLYNGVNGPRSAVRNVHEIEDVLYSFANELPTFNIKPDAPPAFLLDSNRMTGFAGPGDYDNRWSVFPQDMPSASYLMDKGIRSVFVRTDKIRDDLNHILYRYQTQGITVYMNNGTDHKTITVSKPSRFKSLFYRVGVVLGLRRNSAGGFGGLVPEPSGSGG